MMATLKKFLLKATRPDLDAERAYDMWSDSYDRQRGNLMLDLDELIFAKLIEGMDLANKKIADIGCGTGRHWQKIYAKKPKLLMGFDVSEGMLQHLKKKYPTAMVVQSIDNLLSNEPDGSIDCIVSTLTIAHIKNIEEAILHWCRVLKKGGDLVITDFHPGMLARGGRRSFSHAGKSLAVLNYIHPLHQVKNIFARHGLKVIEQSEKWIDETVRPYYEAQNALAVYERFMGLPVIYGLHLKKQLVSK
jgi:ubiquinone/menaquinone biosynthesis C-methylase UbiE